MAKILLVEDEDLVSKIVLDTLQKTGHEARRAADGTAGLQLVLEWAPDLIVLDLNLGQPPSGLDLCRMIRADAATAKIPIVVLTGEPGEELELALFDAGADDYVRKDEYSVPVFSRRVDAVLNRSRALPRIEEVVFGPIALKPTRREALLEGNRLRLTPTEFDVLHRMIRSQGRTLSRDDLLDRGVAAGDADSSRAVDMHIKQIRKKLGAWASLIQTVYGTGYTLAPEPDLAH